MGFFFLVRLVLATNTTESVNKDDVTAILYGAIAGGAALLILIVIIIVVVCVMRRRGSKNNDIGMVYLCL